MTVLIVLLKMLFRRLLFQMFQDKLSQRLFFLTFFLLVIGKAALHCRSAVRLRYTLSVLYFKYDFHTTSQEKDDVYTRVG